MTKKLKKQLEGLDLAEKVVRELVEAGLGTLNGTSVKVYQDLAKQLGHYLVPKDWCSPLCWRFRGLRRMEKGITKRP